MAAIGVSAEEASPLSPKSATISGDAKEVQKTVECTQESHPDIRARVLKVDKAYHSHHMWEIGSEYHAMIKPQLEGKSPLKDFFPSGTRDEIEGHLHDW